MPAFPITAPDGTRYVVNAPEGATAEDALRYAKKLLSRQEKPQDEDLAETPPPPETALEAYRKELDAPIDAWAKTAPIERGFGGNFAAALRRSAPGAMSTLTDQVPALFYSAIGADEAAKEQLKEAKAKQEAAALASPAQFDKVEDVKLGQIFPFLGEKMGEAIPSTGASLGLAAAAIPVAAAIGAPVALSAAVAGFLGSFAFNAPGELQNLFDKTGKLEPAAAAISGGLQSALDIIPEIRMAGALAGPLKKAVVEKLLSKSGMEPSLLKTVAKETGLALAGEGITGGAQTAISIAAEKIVTNNNDVWGSDEFSQILNGAISEAAGGLAFGPVAGAVEYGRVSSEKNRIDEEARVKQEAEDKQNRLNALQGSDEQPGLIAQQQQKIAAMENDPAFDPNSKTQQFALQMQKTQLADLEEELKRALMTPEELETYEEELEKKSTEKQAIPTAPEDVTTVADAFKYLDIKPKEAAAIIESLKKNGTEISLNFKDDISGQSAENLLRIIQEYTPKSEEQAQLMDEFITTNPLLDADAIATAKVEAEQEKFTNLKRGKLTKQYVDNLFAGADTSSPEFYQQLVDISNRGNDAVAREIEKRIAADPNLSELRRAAELEVSPPPLAGEPTAEEVPVEPSEDEKLTSFFESNKSKNKISSAISEKIPPFKTNPETAYAQLTQLKDAVERLNPSTKDAWVAAIDRRLASPQITKWVKEQEKLRAKQAQEESDRAAQEYTGWFEQPIENTFQEKIDLAGEKLDTERGKLQAFQDPEFIELALQQIKQKNFLLAQEATRQRIAREQQAAENKEYLENFDEEQAFQDAIQQASEYLNAPVDPDDLPWIRSMYDRFRENTPAERQAQARATQEEYLKFRNKERAQLRRVLGGLTTQIRKTEARALPDELTKISEKYTKYSSGKDAKFNFFNSDDFKDIYNQSNNDPSAFATHYPKGILKKDIKDIPSVFEDVRQKFIEDLATQAQNIVKQIQENEERRTKVERIQRQLSDTVEYLFSKKPKPPIFAALLNSAEVEAFRNRIRESTAKEKPKTPAPSKKESASVAEAPPRKKIEEGKYEPFTVSDISNYISKSTNYSDLDGLYDVVIDSPEFSETDKETLLHKLNERIINKLVDGQIIVTKQALDFIKEIGAKNIYGRALLRHYIPAPEEVGRLLVSKDKRRFVPDLPKAREEAESKPTIGLSDLRNAALDLKDIARERAQKPRVLDLDSLSDLQYAEFQDTAKRADNHYEAIRLMFGREKALKTLAADMSSAEPKETEKEGLSDKTIKEGNAGTKNRHFGIEGGAGRVSAKAKATGNVDEDYAYDRYIRAHLPLTGGKYGKAFFDSLSPKDREYVIAQLTKYRQMALRHENIVRPFLSEMSEKEKTKVQKEAIRQGWLDALDINKLIEDIQSSKVLSSDTDYGAQLKGDLRTKALWYAQNTVGDMIDRYDYSFKPNFLQFSKVIKKRAELESLRKLHAIDSLEVKKAEFELKKLENELNEYRNSIYNNLQKTYQSFLKFVSKHPTEEYFAKRTMAALADVIAERGLPKGLQSSTVIDLKEGLQRAMRRPDMFGDRVQVLASPRELNDPNIPNDVKGVVIRNPKNPDGFKLYLFADNIPEGEGLAVFLHELAGHIGMKKLVGEGNYKFLIDNINKWASSSSNDIEVRIAKRVSNKVNALKKADQLSDAEVEEELLAYFIEESVKEGLRPTELADVHSPLGVFFRKVLAGVQNLLDKLGLGLKKLTAQDIVNLAYGAAQIELESMKDNSLAARFNAKDLFSAPRVYAEPSELERADVEKADESAQRRDKIEAIRDAERAKNPRPRRNRSESIAQLAQYDRLRRWGIPAELANAPFEVSDEVRAALFRASNPNRVIERLINERNGFIDRASEEEITGQDIEDSSLSTSVKADYRDYDELQDEDGEGIYSSAYQSEMIARTAEQIAYSSVVGVRMQDVLRNIIEQNELENATSDEKNGYKGVYPQFNGKELNLKTRPDIVKLFYFIKKSNGFKELSSEDVEESLQIISQPTTSLSAAREELFSIVEAAFDAKVNSLTNILTRKVGKESDISAVREILDDALNAQSEYRFSRAVPPTLSPQIASNAPVVNALTFGRMQATAAAARPWNGETITRMKRGMSLLRPVATAKLFSLLSNREFASYVEGENKVLAKAIRKIDDAYGLQVAKEAKDRQQISKNLVGWDAIYKKLTSAQKQDFEEVFHETTRLQVKVDDPMFASHALTKRYNRFPPEIKKMYNDIFNSYKQFRERYVDLLDTLTDGDLSTSMKITYEAMRKGLDPYAPLQRYGDYWLTYIDKNKEPVPMAFPTPRDRDDFIKELQARGIKKEDIKPYMRLEDINTSSVPPTAAFARIMESMKKNGASQELVEDVYRTYLSTLPSSSIRQQFQKRKGYSGYEGDALRVYADVATKMAHQLAHMEFLKEADAQAAIARSEAKKNPSDFNTMAYKSLEGRVEFLRSPARDDFASKAGRFSYTYFILNNVSSALMNTLAIPIIVHSVLSGPYGHIKSARAINRAMRMVFKGGFDDNSNLKSVFTGRNLSDITFYGNKARRDKKFESEYADLYDAAVNRTSIRRSTGQEIVSRKTTSINDYTGLRARIEGSLNWIFQNSERFVREVSLLSAYHLALESGATKKQAIQKALNFTEEVNGAATTGQGAPIFHGAVGRFIGIFKKYPMAMMHLQCKLFAQAFKGADPNVRNIARKQLLSIFGMAYLFCGVKGMPLVGMGTLMASLLNGVFGDDDEPFDPDAALLEAVNTINYYGPVGMALNVDLSRAGLTNMFFRSDPERFEKVGAVPYLLESIGGAPVSILLGFERGVEQFQKGNILKGLQAISPSFIRNPIKAFEMMTQGLVNSRGEILRDTSGMDAFKQVWGVTALDVRRTYESNTFLYRENSKLVQRYQSILDQYNIALDSEDIDAALEIEDKRVAWNEKHPEKPITLENLAISRRRHLQNLEDAVDGVRLDPKLRDRLLEKHEPYRPE